MPGALTVYLQEAFARHCPDGWQCDPEVAVLSRENSRIFGYSPRADLLLRNAESDMRIWLEFEISRADPMANHVKFASAHLVQPFPDGDVFLSMVSRHVTKGRRNLALNTVRLMRMVGISAFQTTLFPGISGNDIKELNHSTQVSLVSRQLPVKTEIDRVIAVCTPVVRRGEHAIHFAPDALEVAMNVSQWNLETATDEGKKLWGRRTVTYFAFNPLTGQFAPSKFCAFVAARAPKKLVRSGMSLPFYITLDESEPRFDGHVARRHLQRWLGFETHGPGLSGKMEVAFEKWLYSRKDCIHLHRRGPIVLVPPAWF